ncbi:gliding motility lipoprotein GldJ [Aequorivita marisscotiae]|jgi:gliding motility-associated lipoprotein GldJ|uniref:Gliding motility lipoprotein GldJ n=1 Tax=Aequorivita marisscotiae TaxID=3040348 RepID=A0ABY8KXL0_9FLAO|nr:gliding motility lipoprotein GldJ [Aequorivita sp. Ant34-E75]WGF94113.1 gliding motility lipoprotein GldJ [Aequorivita sp. Ant34-E75]
MFRKNLTLKLFITLIAATLLVGCNKSRDYKNSSRATGWKMNAKEGGFQYNPQSREQETGPGLVFVEGGTFTMGRVQDDPMHDWNNSPNQQHVQSFYMDETEVTNLMYLEYLDWLKQVFPPTDESYRKIYEGAVPDTLVWRNRLGFNEVMTNNYLRHPAYAEYPVVGVSWIQAVEFSNWRTDRVNEMVLANEGITARNAPYEVEPGETFNTATYLNAPTLTYGGNDSITRGGKKSESIAKRSKDSTNLYIQRKDGLLMPAYRLPTEAEWEYAALGLVGLRNYNAYRGKKKYPWEGQYTRSGKRRSRGDQMANFKQGDGDYGGIAGWSDDGADITAQVKSYEPNDFGLYDMAGNVAEWVADVYRPIVDDEFNDFNYYRGNVYTKNAIGEDGKVKVVTKDSIVFDTLSNGKIVARNLPGGILQVPVDENETYLRTNFSQSDNRDYRDGDKRSSRYYQSFADEEGEGADNTNRMYNSPIQKVYVDSSGTLDRQYDKSSNRTTLIDNEVRVYKGGSWRDRDYWLDPAQRRYFPQDMATDYIGFRCAMSRVGSKSKKGKRPRN